MKTFICLLALLFPAIAVNGFAQSKRLLEQKSSSVSKIDFIATNSGVFGFNPAANASGFKYPRGTNNSYLFASGLWFGAKKKFHDSLARLVFTAYEPNAGSIVGAAGEGKGNPVGLATPLLYHSVDFDHATGDSLGDLPGASRWPLWLREGELPRPGYEGVFEPYTNLRNADGGRYVAPAFMPGVGEEFVSRYNDLDLRYYRDTTFAATYGFPIGLQFQENIYGWESGPYQNVVMLRYEVVNISGDTLFDCSLGVMADPDLGGPTDDALLFDAGHPELRSFVGEPGGDRGLGGFMMTLLESPVPDARGYVDNGRRAEYRDSLQIGTLRLWTIETDPTKLQRYDFMTSGQIDNSILHDVRALMASHTFTMRPMDTVHCAVAYAIVPRTGFGVEMPKAEALAGRLIADYYGTMFDNSGVVRDELSTTRSLSVQPNPSDGHFVLGYTLPARAEITVRVDDMLGRTVLRFERGMCDAAARQEPIDLSTLPVGLYLVRVESGSSLWSGKAAVMR